MRSFSRGNSVNPRSRSCLMRALVRHEVRAHLEILEHGQVREDAAPLGRHRDAARDERVRGHAGDVLAVEHRRGPLCGVEQAGDRAQRRRLAGAVGADQRDDLAGVDRRARRRGARGWRRRRR